MLRDLFDTPVVDPAIEIPEGRGRDRRSRNRGDRFALPDLSLECVQGQCYGGQRNFKLFLKAQ